MIELSGSDSFIIFQEPQKKKTFIGIGLWEEIKTEKDFNKDTFVINLFDGLTFNLIGNLNVLDDVVNISCPKKLSFESTNKESYFESITKTISHCKSGGINKCIISRVIKEKFSSSNYFQLFEELTHQYNHGLKYILNHPKYGMWLGVSPETLIKGDMKNGFYSHALAGSKSYDSNTNWTIKEKEEHQYVSDYIEEKILQSGELINCSKTYEKPAGNIIHLNKDFYFKLNTDLFDFINEIHPTPAIAGIPLENSLNFIKQTESHSRDFYSGFIGIMNKNSCNLFVNLRCARINPNEIQLFVGGGITDKSIPKDEFLETEIKSQTLLSVIKKM